MLMHKATQCIKTWVCTIFLNWRLNSTYFIYMWFYIWLNENLYLSSCLTPSPLLLMHCVSWKLVSIPKLINKNPWILSELQDLNSQWQVMKSELHEKKLNCEISHFWHFSSEFISCNSDSLTLLQFGILFSSSPFWDKSQCFFSHWR